MKLNRQPNRKKEFNKLDKFNLEMVSRYNTSVLCQR